jgi:hypothetical protein
MGNNPIKMFGHDSAVGIGLSMLAISGRADVFDATFPKFLAAFVQPEESIKVAILISWVSGGRDETSAGGLCPYTFYS